MDALAGSCHTPDPPEASLRLLVEALIGVDPPPPPLRIFPVRGSSTLRLHSEHGVALCLGISPLLVEQGNAHGENDNELIVPLHRKTAHQTWQRILSRDGIATWFPWGLGIGDWGLGISLKSPIPKHHFEVFTQYGLEYFPILVEFTFSKWDAIFFLCKNDNKN